MYREDICHLDIECRFGTCIEIVELVDIELCLGIRDRDYYMMVSSAPACSKPSP